MRTMSAKCAHIATAFCAQTPDAVTWQTGGMENDDVTSALKAIRTRAGVGVREMARRLGVPPSTYSHYENPARFKARYLPMDEALSFAVALEPEGVAREDLLRLAGAETDTGANQTTARTSPSTLSGFAEEAEAFKMPLLPGDPIRALFGAHARNPAAIYRTTAHLPDFDLRPGDLLICDQARQPVAGDIVVVSLADPDLGHAVTLLRRWLSPWLLPGTPSDAATLQDSDGWAAILYPVIGCIRGV